MRSTEASKDNIHNNIIMKDIKKEYEEFVYTISHDFQAPLRHLKEFSKLLVASIEDKLTEDEKQYATFIEKSVIRLDAMQKALLTLSRIKVDKDSYEKIQMDNFIKEIIQDLERKHSKGDVTIYAEKLHDLDANPVLLNLLFKELLDNACRYGYESGLQKVYIRSYEKEEEIIFEIEDNGIGIDSQFCEAVFSIFRRLHNQDDYGGGIGAGLTIVQKIVEAHGGHIWIKSKLNEGTKILFSIPK